MKCSLCQRELGELSGKWYYCHFCNIQVLLKKSKIQVYDIEENGELILNQMKTVEMRKAIQ